ncbi:hypothetical protein BSKO_04798 [Bryopsis sp. KO-2023]|nr:hypothetical protein BSKO_04798 [Bryopsis sp. KO-2023]
MFSRLSEVYRYMTGDHGDAHCTFPEDKCMLFSEGVTFDVRPDRRRWRPFSTLSGGQQSLATLSLSFALQAAFPSPFYFFDEIDCALDTTNAVRVADYIQKQSSAQYIVVSHKPQVFERAGCLVGIYSAGGSAAAITFPVPKTDQQQEE